MIIPSETLHTYLLKVSHGIFFETVDIGTEHSKVDLVAKLPTEIIKSIYHISSTFLSMKLVPINNSLALCSILLVKDDPEAMFYTSCTHSPKNIDVIIQFLDQGKTELHTFDELNRCVASFEYSFSVPESLIENLIEIKPRICKLTDNEINTIFRNLEKELSQDASTLKLIRFEFKKCNTITINHYPQVANPPIYDPNRFKDTYNIEDSNQGRQFEINLTRLLGKIFNSNCLFPSPFKATPDSKNREFIDLVVVWDDYLLFFEAKAHAITTASSQRSTELRVSDIEKQIQKAINQLRGAYRKAVHNGILTLKTASSNREINLSLFSIHLIIVVSEVHPDLAKSDVVSDVISLGKELAVGVHVMDLHALSAHRINCNDAREFVELLNRRWMLSLSHNIIIFGDE